jgi:hypothetical protein
MSSAVFVSPPHLQRGPASFSRSSTDPHGWPPPVYSLLNVLSLSREHRRPSTERMKILAKDSSVSPVQSLR